MNDEHHLEIHPHKEILPRGLIARVLLVAVCLTGMLSIVAYLVMLAQHARLGAFSRLAAETPREVANVHQELFRTARPVATRNQEQRLLLESYRWIDRSRGLVAIPIDVAMELMVEQNAAPGGTP